MTPPVTGEIERPMDNIAKIRARHDVSAPFQGDCVGSKAQYNQAREDRGVLLAEIERLRALDRASGDGVCPWCKLHLANVPGHSQRCSEKPASGDGVREANSYEALYNPRSAFEDLRRTLPGNLTGDALAVFARLDKAITAALSAVSIPRGEVE